MIDRPSCALQQLIKPLNTQSVGACKLTALRLLLKPGLALCLFPDTDRYSDGGQEVGRVSFEIPHIGLLAYHLEICAPVGLALFCQYIF